MLKPEMQRRKCIELLFSYQCLRPYSRPGEIKHFGQDAQKMDLPLTPRAIQNTVISRRPPQKRDERTKYCSIQGMLAIRSRLTVFITIV